MFSDKFSEMDSEGNLLDIAQIILELPRAPQTTLCRQLVNHKTISI
jgi:hypothetical protein